MLAAGRFAFINVWRSIADQPVLQKPLAVCAESSIDPDDKFLYELRFPGDCLPLAACLPLACMLRACSCMLRACCVHAACELPAACKQREASSAAGVSG